MWARAPPVSKLLQSIWEVEVRVLICEERQLLVAWEEACALQRRVLRAQASMQVRHVSLRMNTIHNNEHTVMRMCRCGTQNPNASGQIEQAALESVQHSLRITKPHVGAFFSSQSDALASSSNMPGVLSDAFSSRLEAQFYRVWNM